MEIQRIKIDSFKVLENIEQQVSGKHMLIMGENGLGKSSFMQFVQIALGKTDNIPPNATGSGEIITTKDGVEYKFHVEFVDGKPKVTITGPSGLRDSRKSALASITGAMEFDIDSFVELSKSTAGRKKQIEIFKSFLPQETKEQLQAFENHVTVAYNERTEVNRKVKEFEGAIKANPLSGQTLSKFQPVDVVSTMAQLKEAQDFNAKIDRVINNSAIREREITNEAKAIQDIKVKLKAMEAAVAEKEDLQKQASKWLSENISKDTSQYEETINSATEANNNYKDAQTLIKQIRELEVLRAESGELTALIESQKSAIEEAIKDIDSPVVGLGYDENGLMYNGIPVNPDSLSTSETMELGVKLKMAENQDLGIIFLERGESLGSARLKEIIDLCNRNKFQIVLEEVLRGQNELKIELFTDSI